MLLENKKPVTYRVPQAVDATQGDEDAVVVRFIAAGYIFDAADVHKPVGADPRQVTVALHFQVHERPAEGSGRE